jgi:hypothetical protein
LRGGFVFGSSSCSSVMPDASRNRSLAAGLGSSLSVTTSPASPRAMAAMNRASCVFETVSFFLYRARNLSSCFWSSAARVVACSARVVATATRVVSSWLCSTSCVLWKTQAGPSSFSSQIRRSNLQVVPPDADGIVTLRPRTFYLADLKEYTKLAPAMAMHIQGKELSRRRGCPG